MEFIFRSIVISTAVLATLLWSMPYFDYMWYSNEQLYLLDQGGLGAKFTGSELLYWGELAVWLALSVGLFFYIKAARIGFVAFYGITILLSVVGGVQIVSPYESAIAALLGLADGAILAMAYLTSIGAKFEEGLLTNQSSRPP